MNVPKVFGCFHSPNGSTKEVVKRIASGMAQGLNGEMTLDSFTLPQQRNAVREYSPNDIVIIGSPTYAGRLPNKILPDFQTKFKGNGAYAILAVTFGNRAFDSSLSELQQVMTENGFKVIAMGAFPCRHVFYEKIRPGSPTPTVNDELTNFIEDCRRKVKNYPNISAISPEAAGPVAPYYIPLGMDEQPAKFLKAKPQTDESKCTHCGICAKVCPMGAIDQENTSLVPGTCIKCQACVLSCRSGAKYFDDPAFLSHIEYLKTYHSTPKTSKTFL